MRKKIEWEWQRLDEATWRSKVIGGWLVKTEFSFNKAPTTSMQFIPDRDHEWEIIAPIIEEKPAVKVAASDFESSKK